METDEALLGRRLKLLQKARRLGKTLATQQLTRLMFGTGWELAWFNDGSLRATLTYEELEARAQQVGYIGLGSFIWSVTVLGDQCTFFWWPVPGPTVSADDPKFHLETYRELCKNNR